MNRRDDFSYVWQQAKSALAVGAPVWVAEALIRSEVTHEVRGSDFILMGLSPALKDYMEEHISQVKPVLWPYIKRIGCNRMIYETNNHTSYGKKSN